MAKQPHKSVDDTLQQDDGKAAEAVPQALYVLYSPDDTLRGRVMRLPRATVKLGRRVADDADIELNDPAVSKAHAEITWSPVRERHLLGDLRSSNGTHLNGTRIERELLEPGDIIRMGDTVFKFGDFDASAVGWTPPDGSLLVGRSGSLRRTLERAERAAGDTMSVLILGETGTGKELVAQTVHLSSGRNGPLRALNCAAIPRELVESELFGHVKGAFSGADTSRSGLFEAADGGTLFLDEVGELAEDTQAKLLRALETRMIRPVGATTERPVDVRIIAATNRDLEAAVTGGAFRADLYARLAEWEVPIAPLRERPEDLYPLWEHFLAQHAGGKSYELRGTTFEALVLHTWPYNAREMLKLVRNIALEKPEGGKIELADLPESIRGDRRDDSSAERRLPTGDLPPPGETPTARELRRLVEEFNGNIKEVAAFLGKDRTQVYRWLKRHNIDPSAYRG